MKTNKPILVVTNDRWGQDTYVVFENDLIIGGCIPDEWIDEIYQNENNTATRDEVAEQMEDDFFNENPSVDEFRGEFLRCGNKIYEFCDNGYPCHYLGEYESLDEYFYAVDEKIEKIKSTIDDSVTDEDETPEYTRYKTALEYIKRGLIPAEFCNFLKNEYRETAVSEIKSAIRREYRIANKRRNETIQKNDKINSKIQELEKQIAQLREQIQPVPEVSFGGIFDACAIFRNRFEYLTNNKLNIETVEKIIS